MDNSLNDTTQDKARELARKITVAHDLDPEIQEELYGHIEDKLLAYKSGEERITDEDAFILVREHFGDAKVIRGLMQEAHAEDMQVNLARLILVAAITTLVSMRVSTWLMYGTGILLRDAIGADKGTYMALMNILIVLTCLIPWILFAYWKSRLFHGKAVWFTSWQTRSLVVFCIGVLGAGLIVPGGVSLLRIHEMATGEFIQLSQRGFSIFYMTHERVWGIVALVGIASVVVFAIRTIGSRVRRIPVVAGVAMPWLCALATWIVLIPLLSLPYYGWVTAMSSIDWSAGLFRQLCGEIRDMAGMSAQGMLGMGLSLTLCASWVWWCNTPFIRTRDMAWTFGAWMSLVIVHSIVPWIRAGVFFDSDNRLLRSGISVINTRIPGTEIWLYLDLGNEGRLLDLPKVATDFTMLLLVVLFVAATLKFPQRDDIAHGRTCISSDLM